jgi:kumamolisin
LIVLLTQKLNRRVGFINPALYALDQTSVFRDITLGSNGAYAAAYGWDPVTGLGSPLGARLLQAMQGVQATQGVGATAQGQKTQRTQAMSTR